MMKKIKQLKISLILMSFLVLLLAGCSNQKTAKPKKTTPSAKTILVNAQKTAFNSMHATWQEKNAAGKIEQDAEAQYTKHPLIVYANVATNSNHYKMWIENKDNYIQMKGTSTNRWFKTRLTKQSSFAELTDNLNGSMLVPFIGTAKLFKVKSNHNGYTVSYQGKNKKVWDAINADSGFTALIGIDLDDAKPIFNQISLTTNKNYQITKMKVKAKYKDDGKVQQMTMNVDQINQIKQLKVPTAIKKSAVDLGKLDKMHR